MADPRKPLLLRPLLWLRHGWPWALAVALLGLVSTVLVLWRVASYDHKDLVRWAGRQVGYEVEAGSVTFPKAGRLVIRNLRVEDFARVEYLELNGSISGLFGRTLDTLRVQGLEVQLGKMQTALNQRQGGVSTKKTTKLFSFTLKNLMIGQSRLILDNLGPGIPPLPVRLGDVTPMVFTNLHLGGAEEDPAAREIQIATLENIIIYSPYDASAPVLAFDKIRVGFSWSGIQQKQLDQLVLEAPTIYIGPDLFWFSDRMKEAAARAPKTVASETPWGIADFQIIQGGLVLTRDGQPAIKLPLTFESQQNGLVLSDFSSLQLARAGFRIPLTNLPYPEYNLSIVGMEGELYFSLPLEERGQKEKDLSNITPALKIKSALWKGLELRDVAISVTFDRKGVYGAVDGLAYQGSVKGGFTVMLDHAMSWNAWASTTGVELDPVTNLLSPEHFVMRGLVDSSFAVKGRSRTVDEFTGKVDLNRPGRMTVNAVDRVLQDLPPEWNSLKKELARISLEAFRDYDYTGGRAEIAFKPPHSAFRLDLDGKQGKRNVNLTWEDRGLLAPEKINPITQTK
ncbi:MAG: hypothetical protein SFU85_05875 [Candidatus Methylacidiphilales bacterium]|nr:hypothetical protein [Candidatus Methylacidiphilales bacterium]